MSSEGEIAISKLEAKVDSLKDQVQQLLEDSASPNKLKKQKDLLVKATALRHIAAKLKEALDEEEEEAALTARLNKTENRLKELAASLEPDEVELDYLNSAKRGSIVTIKDDRDDEDEEEDEEEDDDEDEAEDDEEVDDEERDDDEEEEEEDEEEDDLVEADTIVPPGHVDDSIQLGDGMNTKQDDALPSGIRACRAIYDFDPEQVPSLRLRLHEVNNLNAELVLFMNFG